MKTKWSLLLFLLLSANLVFSQSKKELFETGYSYLLEEENEKAIDYFSEALELDNKYSHSYFNRGYAYKENEEYENALKDFSWVINFSGIDSLQYWAHIYTSSIYRNNLVNLDKALMNTKKALEIDSISASGLHMHGLILHDLEENAEAIKYFTRSIAKDPSDPDPYYDRAITKRKLGFFAEAIKDYDIVIAMDPEYVRAYNNRGYSNTLMGNYAEAIEDLNKSLKLEVSSYSYNNRGFAKLKLGDLKGAKLDCELAIKLDETNSWAYHYLGLVYFEMGKSKKACELFHQAVELGKKEVAEEIEEKCEE